MSDLDAVFTNENKAREYLEAKRWPDGPVCPYCQEKERIDPCPAKWLGKGWYDCRACRKKFTVRVGTLYERSHLPLHKWVYATYLLSCSKKGISSHQLHRMLGVTYKTAWFMSHRIREGMRPTKPGPMGGQGKVVEVDETYMGRRDGKPLRPDTFVTGFGWVSYPRIQTQRKIVALVERGGAVMSFHVDRVTLRTVKEILHDNVHKDSVLMSDEAPFYQKPGWRFENHLTVNHGRKEYVRGTAHTNTIEGYFSIFKRGMSGVYQQCGEQHLHRYLAEFDFRYSNRVALGVNDVARMDKALKGIEGKRLTYRGTNQTKNA